MSPLKFQLYMVWFRIQRTLRLVARWITGRSAALGPRLVGASRWLGSVLLAPLWISFEVYVMLWESIGRRMNGKRRLRTWQRGLFCLALSLLLGLGVFTLTVGWSASPLTLGLSVLHGVMVFVVWKRGARWLRKILRVRPVRPVSPKDAYAGLDLGN